MNRDKHEYVNYRGYLEHFVDECQYCKKLAFIDKCKFMMGMVLAIFIILLVTKYGGYYGWIEKI